MVEFLALNRDVAPDGRSCSFSIRFFQCSHDGLVLGHGLRQASSCPELHPAEGLKTPIKPKALLLQKPVSRLPVQNGVESLVFQVIAIGVLGHDRFITARIGSMKVCQSLVRDAACGKTRTDRFQFGHHLEHFKKLDRTRLAHKDSTPGDLLHKT